MHIHEGAWAENSAQNWGKGWQSQSFCWLKAGGSQKVNIKPQVMVEQNSSRKCFRLIFIIETELAVFMTDLSLLLLLLLSDNIFCSIKIIITDTCSRASIVARLRSQNPLSLKWLPLYQKAISGSFLRGSLHYLLTVELVLVYGEERENNIEICK